MNKAIIYYTDSNLNNSLAKRVRAMLLRNSGGIPIIAVSQKPVRYPDPFGKNICVGKIGRSHLNLYTQILTGLQNTDADIVYMAEHDVLYTPHHYDFVPADNNTFYYNTNCWFVNWKDGEPSKGLYSSPWVNRKATSQLICNRELLVDHLKQRIEILKAGWTIRKGQSGACEPGANDDAAFVRRHDDGVPISLRWAGKWKSEVFHGEFPNIDIRNGQNLTGARRGAKKTYDLPYWGKFKDVIK